MEQEFGLRELYSVKLKSTYPIEINGRDFEVGETVVDFDKIQLANFNEIRKYVTANGGYENRTQVVWESTQAISFTFLQGIFNKTELGLMYNARVLVSDPDAENIVISEREILQVTETKTATLKHIPYGNIFIYDVNTGNKITDFTYDKNILTFQTDLLNIIVDYTYKYDSKVSTMVIGQPTIEGYLSLEGRTRVKDDITGTTKTGIIKIPKLKLTSKLSMNLGANNDPVCNQFSAIGYPIGVKGKSKVMEIIYLNDDLDSDI